MITERVLQQKVLQLFKQAGMLAVKTDSTSTRGWPDLTVITPEGQTFFVELKTKTGRLSNHQKRIHEELTKRGAKIYVIRSLEEAEALLYSDS